MRRLCEDLTMCMTVVMNSIGRLFPLSGQYNVMKRSL